MATAPLIPVEDYIKTYIEGGRKPSCEYIDGILAPKGIGNRKHSRIQRRLLELLQAFSDFEAFPELHARLRDQEFRISDIAVEKRPVTDEYYPTKAVYLCIEILSPDQTLGQMLEKCEHYHAWGTRYCWVVNSERQTAWEYHQNAEPKRLGDETDFITAGDITFSLAEIFAVLSQQP